MIPDKDHIVSNSIQVNWFFEIHVHLSDVISFQVKLIHIATNLEEGDLFIVA